MPYGLSRIFYVLLNPGEKAEYIYLLLLNDFLIIHLVASTGL